MKKYILMSWTENRPQLNDKANFNFCVNDTLEQAESKLKAYEEWNIKRRGVVKTKPLKAQIFEFDIA